MPTPYKYLVGYILGIVVALFLFAISLFYFPRAVPVHPLPNFNRYELGSKFDLSTCKNYTEVEYGASWYYNGPLGYCTLTDYLPPGLTQVSIMLHGSFIDAVTFRVSSSVKVIDFINAWGIPVVINKWGTTTQYNWVGRKLYFDHKNGGSVDNVGINYIYFWGGGA